MHINPVDVFVIHDDPSNYLNVPAAHLNDTWRTSRSFVSNLYHEPSHRATTVTIIQQRNLEALFHDPLAILFSNCIFHRLIS